MHSTSLHARVTVKCLGPDQACESTRAILLKVKATPVLSNIGLNLERVTSGRFRVLKIT